MAGVTPKIETRFTLAGIREATSGLRKFGQETRDSFAKIKKETAAAFRPAEADIQRLQRSMKVLKATSIGGVTLGFQGLEKVASKALTTVKVSAIAATAAVTGIGAAAIKASKDSAEELDKLAKDSRRLGVSPEDLSVLGFAAEQEGADPNEVIKGIAKIGSAFVDVRKKIAAADSEFEKFRSGAKGDALLSLFNRGDDGKWDSSEFLKIGEDVNSKRSGSLAAIKERMAYLQSQLSQGDVYGRMQLDKQQAAALSKIPENQRALVWAKHLHDVRKELDELTVAQETLQKSFGPSGEALFGLEKYGLDIDRAARGGVDGLLALSDAIRQVQDPTERLRYSVLLFGEDAGPKLLPLLLKGRQGIEDYRKELERLGGVKTSRDTKLGEDYEESAINLRRAIGGIKLAIARELLPSMTEVNRKGTEFLVRYRQNIADMVKAGFDGAQNLAADAIDAYNGKRSGFRTEWLNAALAKVREIREQFASFRKEVADAFEGKSSMPWLNTVASGLKTAKAFALDVVAVFKGQDAKDFGWLNDVRDGIKEFIADVRTAFDMFREAMKPIVDYVIKPLGSFLGTNVLATSLFVGMLRFSGLLGTILATLRGIWTVGRTVFGLGSAAVGLASRVAGPATAAAGAAGTVAGAAGKGAAGADVAAAAILSIKDLANTSITQIVKSGDGLLKVVGKLGVAVGLLAASAEVGWKIGEKLGKWVYDNTTGAVQNKTYDLTAQRVKLEGDASFHQRYQSLGLDRRKQLAGQLYGIDYDDGYRAAAWAQKAMETIRDPNAIHLTPDRSQPSETIALRLDINGKQATGTFPALDARRIAQEANRMNRMGGY
jgi:hypothetical protein